MIKTDLYIEYKIMLWKYPNVMDIMMTNNKIIVMNKASKQL